RRPRKPVKDAPGPVAGAHPPRVLAGGGASTGFWTVCFRAGRSHRKTPTRCGQADADCPHPIPRADRLAADKPKYETVGGGAGEGALASGTPCAIWLAAPRH